MIPQIPQMVPAPRMPRSVPAPQTAALSQLEATRVFLRGLGVPESELQGSYAELMDVARRRMSGGGQGQ